MYWQIERKIITPQLQEWRKVQHRLGILFGLNGNNSIYRDWWELQFPSDWVSICFCSGISFPKLVQTSHSLRGDNAKPHHGNLSKTQHAHKHTHTRNWRGCWHFFKNWLDTMTDRRLVPWLSFWLSVHLRTTQTHDWTKTLKKNEKIISCGKSI